MKTSVILLLLLLAGGIQAEAATFVVNANDDSDDLGFCQSGDLHCTLREAIRNAADNGSTPTDYINFDLPNCSGGSGSGCTIVLLAELPQLTSDVFVNGFTQPGTNYKTLGSKIKPGLLDNYNPCSTLQFPGPDVAIDASGAINGLKILGAASNVTIKGLSIYGAKIEGAAVLGEPGTGTARLVESNFIGVLPNGADPVGTRNQGFGIRQMTPGNITANKNYVGYNGQGGIDGAEPLSVIEVTNNEAFKNGWNSDSHDGIDLNGRDSVARCNLSRHNTNNTGVPEGDSGTGLEIGSKTMPEPDTMDNNRAEYNTLYRNRSGGMSIRKGPRGNFIKKNVIWDNHVGITVNAELRPGTNRNMLSVNSIFKNQGLGIDLQHADDGNAWENNPDGVTPNDPCDVDNGAVGDGMPTNTASNDLQNHPVDLQAARHKKKTFVWGKLNSTPDTTFDIEFYSTPATDMGSSADREGKHFLGHVYTTTNAACEATFSAQIMSGVPDNHRITATARIFEDDAFTSGTSKDPWSTSEFSKAIKPPQQDSDDFDSDGKRDDQDSDCDNDGKQNDEDSDDDNDGKKDDEDSDDDSDGVKDKWDHKGRKEKQDSNSDKLSPGQSHSYSMSVDLTSLALIAAAQRPLADDPIPDPDELLDDPLDFVEQPLLVEIYDPLGTLVASSLPIPGVALATTVPILAGEYTVKVKNVGTKTHSYDSFLVTSEEWLP